MKNISTVLQRTAERPNKEAKTATANQDKLAREEELEEQVPALIVWAFVAFFLALLLTYTVLPYFRWLSFKLVRCLQVLLLTFETIEQSH